jgi:DNA-binding transcriptional ArsR family regulator
LFLYFNTALLGKAVMRDWRDNTLKILNSATILFRIHSSKEGLTFGQLLKITEVSKPTLSKHLKELMKLNLVLQEGLGRDRRYKATARTLAVFESEGEDRYIWNLIFFLFEHLPTKEQNKILAEATKRSRP